MPTTDKLSKDSSKESLCSENHRRILNPDKQLILWVGDGKLDNIDFALLTQQLCNPKCIIEKLELGYQDLAKLSISYLKPFFEALAVNSSVMHLRFYSTHLGANNSELLGMLVQALKTNKTITQLAIESDYLDHSSTNALVEIFNNTRLAEVDLCANSRLSIAEPVALAIRNNKTLKKLDLTHIGMTVSHFKTRLVPALQHNICLTSIRISQSIYHDTSILAQAGHELLSHTPKVTLDNEILSIFNRNRTLFELFYFSTDYPLSKPSEDLLKHLLNRNKYISYIMDFFGYDVNLASIVAEYCLDSSPAISEQLVAAQQALSAIASTSLMPVNEATQTPPPPVLITRPKTDDFDANIDASDKRLYDNESRLFQHQSKENNQ